jgi:dephospho-CoA kinase
MITAGLTGNYGMGKSFVLSLFRELGAIVLDSDDIVEHLLEERKVISGVKKILGNDVLMENNSLDKKKIATIIFNNNELRRQLEALLHPMVFEKVESWLRKIKNRERVVIVEVPLLFEGGYQSRFDRTITVFTTQKAALERLAKGGVSRSNALRRLKAQLPIRIKKKKADYLVDNNGAKQMTLRQVESIYEKLIDEMV